MGNKFGGFKSAGLKDWESAAREELNGASPWEKLIYKGEGWFSRPYYEQSQSVLLPPLLPVSGNEFLGARTWFNCPRVVVGDARKSNELALNFLQQGADGIFFELKQDVNFDLLLEGIDPQYCSLSFLANENPVKAAAALKAFLFEKKSPNTKLHGGFFGNAAIESSETGIFKFSGFQISSTLNPGEDIAEGFKKMISATASNMGFLIHSIAFSVSVGTDFFMELARLRAIRMVWKRFLAEQRLPHESTLFLHAVSLPWKGTLEPHGNMLKGTTAAMASILGGCDALTIDAENADQPMQLRVARNISNILREESFFSKVADPVAGSYYIEDLSSQIAEGAWKSIQSR